MGKPEKPRICQTKGCDTVLSRHCPSEVATCLLCTIRQFEDRILDGLKPPTVNSRRVRHGLAPLKGSNED